MLTHQYVMDFLAPTNHRRRVYISWIPMTEALTKKHPLIERQFASKEARQTAYYVHPDIKGYSNMM